MAARFMGGSADGGAGVTIRSSTHGGTLPLSYAPRIEAISGAHEVAWYTMQFLTCGNNAQVMLAAWGGPGTLAQVSPPGSKDSIPAATLQRWRADPIGALVTKQAAADCGWRVGEGVDPPVAFGHSQIPLHVIGAFNDSGDAAYVHFAYINRVAPMMGKDKVLNFVASAGSVQGDEPLAARIEAAFANDFPTVTATTNTTVQNAFARYGKVQQLMFFVMVAILLCTGSVLVSVLAHTAVERRAKLAVLQALGFRRSTLLGAFVMEALGVAIAGVIGGIALGELSVHLEPTSLSLALFQFVIPGWAFWWIPLWVAILMIVALAWPLGLIARVRPIDLRET